MRYKMSQFWHAHWVEGPFKPASLGNWQVPNWHPKFPCGQHCATTTFLADRSGRLLPDRPRSNRSPWGDFKGTWELPLKIDRKLARQLSAPSKHKQAAWEAHKIYYQGTCDKTVVSPRKMDVKAPAKEIKVKKATDRGITRVERPVAKIKETVTKSSRIADINLKSTLPKKAEKYLTQQESIENVDREEHEFDEKSVAQKQTLDQMDREEYVGDEKNVAHEQPVKKSDRDDYKEKKKSKCFCVYKSDSRSLVEVTTKTTRNNICTVHQRLRV